MSLVQRQMSGAETERFPFRQMSGKQYANQGKPNEKNVREIWNDHDNQRGNENYGMQPLRSFEKMEILEVVEKPESSRRTRGRNWAVVDVHNGATRDWTANTLDAGNVVSGFAIKNSSNEGQPPIPTIGAHETHRPLSLYQLGRLEGILQSLYEVDSVRYPPIRVSPVEIITRLKQKIVQHVEGAQVKSIRIMGGVATHIMKHDFPFNDLDILFNLDFGFDQRHRVFKQIRDLVCRVIHDLLMQLCPEELERVVKNMQITHEQAMTDFATAYFQKYVIVPPAHIKDATEDGDCWSLICLRNLQGENLEFKFVRCTGESSSLRRHFEFSTDSFQIAVDDLYLDSLFRKSKGLRGTPALSLKGDDPADNPDLHVIPKLSYSWIDLDEVLFPRVYVVCLYPDFDEALNHLAKKEVHIFRPEEVRGGCFLKYAYLRQHNFRDDPSATPAEIRMNINAMVCRFLITQQDSNSQWSTIHKYLNTHYPRCLKSRVSYLLILLNILAQSNASAIEQAKCLFGVINSMMEIIRMEIKAQEDQMETHDRSRKQAMTQMSMQKAKTAPASQAKNESKSTGDQPDIRQMPPPSWVPQTPNRTPVSGAPPPYMLPPRYPQYRGPPKSVVLPPHPPLTQMNAGHTPMRVDREGFPVTCGPSRPTRGRDVFVEHLEQIPKNTIRTRAKPVEVV